MYKFCCKTWNYSLLCATIIHNLQQPDLLQGHWHPSVLKDYGFALRLEVLEKRLWWLERPIRE